MDDMSAVMYVDCISHLVLDVYSFNSFLFRPS